MAVNEFSDLTENEFDSLYMGGYKRMPQVTKSLHKRSKTGTEAHSGGAG